MIYRTTIHSITRYISVTNDNFTCQRFFSVNICQYVKYTIFTPNITKEIILTNNYFPL